MPLTTVQINAFNAEAGKASPDIAAMLALVGGDIRNLQDAWLQYANDPLTPEEKRKAALEAANAAAARYEYERAVRNAEIDSALANNTFLSKETFEKDLQNYKLFAQDFMQQIDSGNMPKPEDLARGNVTSQIISDNLHSDDPEKRAIANKAIEDPDMQRLFLMNRFIAHTSMYIPNYPKLNGTTAENQEKLNEFYTKLKQENPEEYTRIVNMSKELEAEFNKLVPPEERKYFVQKMDEALRLIEEKYPERMKEISQIKDPKAQEAAIKELMSKAISELPHETPEMKVQFEKNAAAVMESKEINGKFDEIIKNTLVAFDPEWAKQVANAGVAANATTKQEIDFLTTANAVQNNVQAKEKLETADKGTSSQFRTAANFLLTRINSDPKLPQIDPNLSPEKQIAALQQSLERLAAKDPAKFKELMQDVRGSANNPDPKRMAVANEVMEHMNSKFTKQLNDLKDPTILDENRAAAIKNLKIQAAEEVLKDRPDELKAFKERLEKQGATSKPEKDDARTMLATAVVDDIRATDKSFFSGTWEGAKTVARNVLPEPVYSGLRDVKNGAFELAGKIGGFFSSKPEEAPAPTTITAETKAPTPEKPAQPPAPTPEETARAQATAALQPASNQQPAAVSPTLLAAAQSQAVQNGNSFSPC